ncbi:MAG: hypothetical protein ACK6A9_21915 [Dolichospermum sp.]|jgi:hypothetical protein
MQNQLYIYNREQGIGNREQGIGNREQGTDKKSRYFLIFFVSKRGN